MSIMGLFMFLLYIFIIFVLLSSPRLRRKKSNQLLMNLSIGHLMTGLSHFAGMWTTFHVSRFVFLGVFYANISLVTLTIDRCIYIRFPFRYQLLNRGVHVLFMTVSPVLCIVLLFAYSLDGLNNPANAGTVAKIPFLSSLVVTTGMLFIPNLVVFRIVRRQRMTILRSQCRDPRNDLSSNVYAKRSEIRTFYICFGCACTYTLLWFPIFVLKVVEIFNGTQINYTHLAISAIVSNMNPFADAFFCICFNKEIKCSLKRLFKRNKTPSKAASPSTSSKPMYIVGSTNIICLK